MSKIITKNSEKYSEVVKLYDNKKYEIETSLLNCGDTVVCPVDKDMLISKDEKGEIKLTKKRYSSTNPFKKQQN